ncbi:alpha/beta fold hydrolase [Sulfitobacter sp. D35]|uniref:alpha/beta fold hydrolase BchO n=1 Tax=Sulfitobacter sp. D35 TaxID=3083252 RepID=UPI00296E2F66|nr:alpha/beta fold hydrolase BchO [Sulfitobacter sp. D35]MDW4499431.1 alpha/beta fold hydrolase [Sulfitobacter sp. D35]
MDWARDLPSWPLNHLSREVDCRPHRWHVQETGEGPTLLLLHGAGATTHSWRDLIPPLAETFHVIAIDLPGHGFTRLGTKSRSGLPTTVDDILALLKAEAWQPAALIGHSAGAAVALSLAERLGRGGGDAPPVVAINAALGRFEGVASWLFPFLARALALNPLTALAFSAGAPQPARARRLIEGTGSRLTDEGIMYYARLIADRAHVDGTLQMMSQWNVDALSDSLPGLSAPCLFITGQNDSAVSPEISSRAAARMAQAKLLPLDGLGHLAHEEDPARVLEPMLDWLGDTC